MRAGLDEVSGWRSPRELAPRLLRFGAARCVTADLRHLYSPLKSALALRALSRGHCWFEDDAGATRPVTIAYLGRLVARRGLDQLTAPAVVRRVAADVRRLAAASPDAWKGAPGEGEPLYLRTDLVFDVDAGGAAAHIAGVANNLCFRGRRPRMLTTAAVPLVDQALTVELVLPDSAHWSIDYVARLAFNDRATEDAHRFVGERAPAFIYHRNTAYSFAGARLAAELGVPFLLEYNGSDAWISRHWGGSVLPHEDLATDIEDLNFTAARLIVVVSDALAEQLVARGVAPDRILVNPNGVDTQRFRPDIDGAEVRRRYGVGADEVVVGFIGTFGAWHGAEVLAEAFVEIRRRRPTLPLRLVMVGDGPRRQETEAVIGRAGVQESVVFTGLVPQVEGPDYLAACDILVAPHVPNPDGTAFFGSPTKLFEYLAMGRAVVASDLDQLGTIVVDDVSGLLVPPGDVPAMAGAIERLSEDPALRQRLGVNARAQATREHTWKQHADRIVDRLEQILVAS